MITVEDIRRATELLDKQTVPRHAQTICPYCLNPLTQPHEQDCPIRLCEPLANNIPDT